MKTTYRYLFLLLMGLCMNTIAQTDTLKVLNLIVTREIHTEMRRPMMDTSASASVNDTLFYKAVYAISNVQQLSEVYIQVGNEKNQGTDVNVSFTKSMVNNKAQLQTAAGVVYKIWGNRGYYTFYLLNSNTTVGSKWLTIYFKDNTGAYSPKQYYKF